MLGKSALGRGAGVNISGPPDEQAPAPSARTMTAARVASGRGMAQSRTKEKLHPRVNGNG
jgi:hypothetical protein